MAPRGGIPGPPGLWSSWPPGLMTERAPGPPGLPCSTCLGSLELPQATLRCALPSGPSLSDLLRPFKVLLGLSWACFKGIESLEDLRGLKDLRGLIRTLPQGPCKAPKGLTRLLEGLERTLGALKGP